MLLRFVASYDTRNLVRARKQVERYSQMDQISISSSLLSLPFIFLDVKIADLETVGDPVTPAKFLQYCQFIYHELPIRIYIFCILISKEWPEESLTLKRCPLD